MEEKPRAFKTTFHTGRVALTQSHHILGIQDMKMKMKLITQKADRIRKKKKKKEKTESGGKRMCHSITRIARVGSQSFRIMRELLFSSHDTWRVPRVLSS